MNIPVFLLLVFIGACASSEMKESNRTLVKGEPLDSYADLLIRKYASEDLSLDLQKFTALWTSLLGSVDTNSTIPTCSGPKELFDSAFQKQSQPSERLDRSGFKEICPLMIYQLDSEACHKLKIESHQPEHGRQPDVTTTELNSKKPTTIEVWGYGILFVTLISLCSLVGVSVLPLMGKAFYSKLLTVLIGLAVGSLSGSSVFHLIPQAFGLMETDPHHRYLQTSVLLIGGIWLFFMIERFLKIIMDWKEARTREERIGSSPNHQPMILEGSNTSNSGNNSTQCGIAVDRIYESQEQVIKASFGHQAKPQRSHSHEHMIHYKTGDSPIATLAWMIIFGDGFHNFIDGLSLGAAFNESIPTGISISLAVMCEELPHELGDFAVLLSAGMTMRQALIYNFLSACTCYLGLAVGIVLGEFEASQYIFALAGGMFLYIALVDMMPEMNEVAEEASKESVAGGLRILFLQNLGILSGVAALYLLAKYQDQIRFG